MDLTYINQKYDIELNIKYNSEATKSTLQKKAA